MFAHLFKKCICLMQICDFYLTCYKQRTLIHKVYIYDRSQYDLLRLRSIKHETQVYSSRRVLYMALKVEYLIVTKIYKYSYVGFQLPFCQLLWLHQIDIFTVGALSVDYVKISMLSRSLANQIHICKYKYGIQLCIVSDLLQSINPIVCT